MLKIYRIWFILNCYTNNCITTVTRYVGNSFSGAHVFTSSPLNHATVPPQFSGARCPGATRRRRPTPASPTSSLEPSACNNSSSNSSSNSSRSDAISSRPAKTIPGVTVRSTRPCSTTYPAATSSVGFDPPWTTSWSLWLVVRVWRPVIGIQPIDCSRLVFICRTALFYRVYFDIEVIV